jgi:inner membrane protein
VGSALVIFFLLLVSLSEHVPFGYAYIAASLACTALLTYYGVFVLKSARGGLALGGALGLLYGALYVLLLREQTALVLGAFLLFAVLAAVMRVTRNVDWYGVIGQMRAEVSPPTKVEGGSN